MFLRVAAGLALLAPLSTTLHAQVASDEVRAESIGATYSAKLAFASSQPGVRGPVSTRPTAIELSAECPIDEAKLPPLSKDRRFGTVRLGRSGKIYVVLDRSDPSQPWFDKLIIDANTNRDFRDDPVYEGKSLVSELRHRGYTEFTGTSLSLYYGTSTEENFSFTFYIWYPTEGEPLTEMFYTAASWREGEVTLQGETLKIAVFDNDSDGLFTIRDSLWALRPTGSDGAPIRGDDMVPAAIPLRVKGIPYRIAQIMPEGRHVELTEETESKAREAELSYDPLSSEPLRTVSDHPISWASDVDAALKIASTDRKRVFVLFSVDWSKECDNLLSRTMMDQEVVTLVEGNYVAVRLNADSQPELMSRFNVTAAPTMLILNRDGAVDEQIVGYRQARTLVNALRRYR